MFLGESGESDGSVVVCDGVVGGDFDWLIQFREVISFVLDGVCEAVGVVLVDVVHAFDFGALQYFFAVFVEVVDFAGGCHLISLVGGG